MASRADAVALQRLAAAAAMCLVVLWAITHRFEQGHWWSAVLLVAALGTLAAVLARRARAETWALAVATAAGLAERVWRTPFRESDVLPYMREAIQTLLAGQNPYTHLNLATSPLPSYGFAYPPGPLLVYLPFMPLTADLRAVERVTSLLVVLLIAAVVWRAGAGRAALATALFGVFELAGFRALDGSNDSTLTFLFLSAFLLLLYSERAAPAGRILFWASLVPFTLAILFKQLVWPLAFFVLVVLWRTHPEGRRYSTATVLLSLALALPFVVWGPVAFARGIFFEPFNHTQLFGASLWAVVDELRPGLVRALGPAVSAVGLLALGATVVALLRRPPSDLVGGLAAGLAAFFVALTFARWTTSVYYIFAFALLCVLVALWPIAPRGAADG